MRRVDTLNEMVQPCDYVLADVCANCHAQGRELSSGGGVEYHYTFCTGSVPKRGFLIQCKCGKLLRSHKDHTVHCDEPLTVSPSWLCTFNGCHSFITNGVWSDC